MGIEKLLNSIGLEVVYEDEEDDFETDTVKDEYRERSEARKAKRAEAREVKDTKDTNLTITTDNNIKAKVVLVEPEKFTDARKVCRELKAGNVVVVNFEKLSETDSLRVYDVIQGATFVLEGSIQDISDNVTVAAPHNVDIQTNDLTPKNSYSSDAELDYGF